ncbi:Retrotransposon protein, unclassified, expressed [Trichuris trichiura]|uniref:Retrotransposon protein, unclassified, expressed n=1 Tax=Trichuris trichiura TaxID=36087 RepID=A0A077Z203_TRITR|nr:Retrotransposon protein, unclassified, expressed [Trichuris trichiura]
MLVTDRSSSHHSLPPKTSPIRWTTSCATDVLEPTVSTSCMATNQQTTTTRQDILRRFLAWIRGRKYTREKPAKMKSSASWPFGHKVTNGNFLKKDLTICTIPVAPIEAKDWPYIDDEDDSPTKA